MTRDRTASAAAGSPGTGCGAWRRPGARPRTVPRPGPPLHPRKTAGGPPVPRRKLARLAPRLPLPAPEPVAADSRRVLNEIFSEYAG
ncbi:hypothetical protein GCM10010417_06160 [Streptomyces carpaticus]